MSDTMWPVDESIAYSPAPGSSPSLRNPRQVRPSSKLGCDAALAALRVAGERGIAFPVLKQLVMNIGGCSEDAADQQLRIYVRPEITIWSPSNALRGRGTRTDTQIWQLY
jgi:hypothetical protein